MLHYSHYSHYERKRKKNPITVKPTGPSELTKRAQAFEPLGIGIGIVLIGLLAWVVYVIFTLLFGN